MNPTLRVLLLASSRGYSTDDFARAAERIGVELSLGTDRCHVLAETWPEGALALDFRDPEHAAEQIAAHARERPFAGILATDETTAVIAAHARVALGLPTTHPDELVNAVRQAGDKLLFRRQLSREGLLQPRFTTVPVTAGVGDARVAMAAAGIDYPVVMKPLNLSASRGVMRADDDQSLQACMSRLARLLARADVRESSHAACDRMLIESFVPGRELSYEGLLDRGKLHTLALFDKPDPLDGPFFAETIYVTPSVETAAVQARITASVRAAVTAIGLADGPVHAELRLSGRGPVVIELAARPIGGLCHRALRFPGGVTLAELLLLHAAGRFDTERHRGSSARASTGVFMLPVPRAGVLRDVQGVERAREVSRVTDVVITARVGENVLPLPEGSSYMGFVFAEAERPGQVTSALRRAARHIRFRIAPTL